MNKKLLEWVIGNDTGLSSKTIWAAIMDVEIPTGSIPYDHYDFERCWSLLKLCDEETKEKALHKLAERYEMWKPFVRYWPELEKAFIYGGSTKLNKCLRELRNKKIDEASERTIGEKMVDDLTNGLKEMSGEKISDKNDTERD